MPLLAMLDGVNSVRSGSLVRFQQLGSERRKLLVRAILTLWAASAAVALLPFRWAIRFGAVPMDSNPALKMRLEDCVWAVEAAARRTPWRAMCIEKGLAVQRMLRKSGIGATLHYGARQFDGELQAHVWVTVDGRSIIGGDQAEDFAEVATYP